MSSSDRDGSNTPSRSLSYIHIFVDNSNLFIGSQLGQGKNGQQDASTRINVANLVKIIEKDKRTRSIKTRIVGGSTPPRNSRVWTEWEKCNYTCLLGERSFSNKEVFLDDMLHSKIQNLILKNKINEGYVKQNLILITGDGNDNNNRTSFPDIVTIALDYGWTVEIWSWKSSLSNKFVDIQRKYSSKMKINYLDIYRSNITFIQKQKQKQEQKQNINSNNSIFLFLGLVLICLIIYYFKIL